MKVLIFSDIHSNIYALEAIWEKEHDSDLILCAGDLVDYGPYPRQVLTWIREHNVLCVQGNHDASVALTYRKGNTLETVAEDDRAWVHLNASLLEESDIEFLEQLPISSSFELDGIAYGMQHIYRDYKEIARREPLGSLCIALKLKCHNIPGIFHLIHQHTFPKRGVSNGTKQGRSAG
jgi:predicted phosphodiesterase